MEDPRMTIPMALDDPSLARASGEAAFNVSRVSL
jgi:hypothetical protein